MINEEKIVTDYYAKHYREVHSKGVLGFANRFMHKKLEPEIKALNRDILELGCGNFEHFNFVKSKHRKYIATDIRNPPKYLKKAFEAANEGNKFLVADARNLQFKNNEFDLVISGCLIVHIADILSVIQEWQRVCKSKGEIRFVVPCDPGVILRIFRRIISVPTAKSMNVDKKTYQIVNAIEHVSSFSRTKTLVKSAVLPDNELKIQYYPFRFLKSWNLNAFAIFTIHVK